MRVLAIALLSWLVGSPMLYGLGRVAESDPPPSKRWATLPATGSPEGATERNIFRPFGALGAKVLRTPGLTPWASFVRPFGTKRRIPVLHQSITCAAWLFAPPGDPPSDQNTRNERSDTDASQARISEILTQLEKRSDGLTDIRCKVKFVEDDRINLTKRIKIGEILFLISEPNPHFLVHFEKTQADGLLGKQEWYLFDGRWLYEALERIRQVTKREIARPGEKVELFDLEKAPFPLPFGQKKDKILRNFDVTLVSPAPGDPLKTDHLVCIPKQGSAMDGKYDKLEFFVDRDVHLPSRIVVTKNDGLEINTADFPDLSKGSINTGVKKKEFQRPSAWKKYEEVVEPLAPAGRSPP